MTDQNIAAAQGVGVRVDRDALLEDMMSRGAIREGRPKIAAPEDNLDVILQDRRRTHGDFCEHAYTTQSFKRVAQATSNWAQLNAEQAEAVDMILHKIGRILAGDPSHADHWDDICGYGRLGRNACGK